MTDHNLTALIDHTLLKPEATKEQIIQYCEDAKQYEFAAVCVNPTWVETCAQLLEGTNVRVATVIGFPLGATMPEVKAFETKKAIEAGATEVDMVINIGALKDGNNDLVDKDIRSVVEEAKGKALVKVIIETALLTNEEKVRACIISKNAGADYVKTSTGFSSGGATSADVQLMRETIGENMGVKASGGIQDRQSAIEMVHAGATRIGASSGIAIVEGQKQKVESGAGY